jgi:hypothetical protein
MSLVLKLRDDRIRSYDRQNQDRFREMPGGGVSGAHSTFALLHTAGTASILGVLFKPGGAVAFLPLSAAELRDAV